MCARYRSSSGSLELEVPRECACAQSQFGIRTFQFGSSVREAPRLSIRMFQSVSKELHIWHTSFVVDIRASALGGMARWNRRDKLNSIIHV